MYAQNADKQQSLTTVHIDEGFKIYRFWVNPYTSMFQRIDIIAKINPVSKKFFLKSLVVLRVNTVE